MAFCSKCGKQLEDNVAVCPECGTPVDAAQSQTGTTEQAQPAATVQAFDQNDIQENKILALFSYIGILFLIPLLAKPNSAFCRFHVNQGLVLFIAEIICSIIPCIGWIADIALLVFAIMGIVNAVKGEAKELPLIGKIRILK